MRANSGKGDGSANLLDPTVKEREGEKGKSGEAILKSSRGGKRQSSEGGPPGKR